MIMAILSLTQYSKFWHISLWNCVQRTPRRFALGGPVEWGDQLNGRTCHVPVIFAKGYLHDPRILTWGLEVGSGLWGWGSEESGSGAQRARLDVGSQLAPRHPVKLKDTKTIFPLHHCHIISRAWPQYRRSYDCIFHYYRIQYIASGLPSPCTVIRHWPTQPIQLWYFLQLRNIATIKVTLRE